MCETCGCATGHDEFTIHRPDEEEVSDKKSASAEHEHHNEADHSSHKSRIIHLETDILSKNNLLAERNRGYFQAKKIKAFNLVSSPGSGKTTLLEKLITYLSCRKEKFMSLKAISKHQWIQTYNNHRGCLNPDQYRQWLSFRCTYDKPCFA